MPNAFPGRGPWAWRSLVAMSLLAAGPVFAAAPRRTLRSPDGRLEVRIDLSDRIRYGIALRGRPLLADSTLAMTIDGTVLGAAPRLKSAKPTSVDRDGRAGGPTKAAQIREHYNELRLDLDRGLRGRVPGLRRGRRLSLRDDAARSPRCKVYGEEASFGSRATTPSYYPKEESFFSHNEREFLRLAVKDIAPDSLASLPAVVEAPEGVKIAIAESDVEDYPGPLARGQSGKGLSAIFPPYPLQERARRAIATSRS